MFNGDIYETDFTDGPEDNMSTFMLFRNSNGLNKSIHLLALTHIKLTVSNRERQRMLHVHIHFMDCYWQNSHSYCYGRNCWNLGDKKTKSSTRKHNCKAAAYKLLLACNITKQM